MYVHNIINCRFHVPILPKDGMDNSKKRMHWAKPMYSTFNLQRTYRSIILRCGSTN